jgi:hypothetical protein
MFFNDLRICGGFGRVLLTVKHTAEAKCLRSNTRAGQAVYAEAHKGTLVFTMNLIRVCA